MAKVCCPAYQPEMPLKAGRSFCRHWQDRILAVKKWRFTDWEIKKVILTEFVDAVFYLYEQFKQCGATIIGEWATEGYKFKASKAVVDGRFVGLALDQENQKDLTPDRLDSWLNNAGRGLGLSFKQHNS